jgi:hypothetical protein
LKIKSNYSVRPDDDTRKMYEHVGVLFVMWNTIHFLVHIL